MNDNNNIIDDIITETILVMKILAKWVGQLVIN